MAEDAAGAWALRLSRQAQRALRSRTAPWLSLAFGLVMAVALLCVALLAVRDAGMQMRPLVTHIEALQHSAAIAERTSDATTPSRPPNDFTHHLPRTPEVRPLLAELERSTAEAGVTFGGVQFQERAATLEQLARTDVTVSLRGNYPNLKRVVLDVLARFPNITVAQWRLRRAPQAGDAESTLVLAVWGAAADAVPSGAVASPAAEKVR